VVAAGAGKEAGAGKAAGVGARAAAVQLPPSCWPPSASGSGQQ
jgi:hypothetical protein